MISLTPDEIATMIKARDLVEDKLKDSTPANELWLNKAHDALMSVLEHTVLDAP